MAPNTNQGPVPWGGILIAAAVTLAGICLTLIITTPGHVAVAAEIVALFRAGAAVALTVGLVTFAVGRLSRRLELILADQRAAVEEAREEGRVEGFAQALGPEVASGRLRVAGDGAKR